MTPFAVLALYPVWAIALATGLVALRLGRETRGGLVALCAGLAVWTTGIILLVSGFAVAERVLPFGMLLAGAILHAGSDVAGANRKRILLAGYAYGAVIALLGLVWPRLLYGPLARGAGPLFVPLAAASSIFTLLTFALLLRDATRVSGRERRRRLAVAIACGVGALGGGGVISLRVFEWGDAQLAAPPLFIAVALTAYAVFAGEEPRVRDRLVQGAVQAVVTAALSAVGLTFFYLWLPWLAPGAGRDVTWLIIVVFFAALPLEPLRMLLVERVGAAIFAKPIGVPALADRVEASEARAEHAERLAELGRVVAAVAHEIRNPLGVIAAQTKLLERKGAPPETLAAMRDQVERARRFLDDLLRYGKARPLELREMDATAAIQLAVSNVRQGIGAGAPRVEVTGERVMLEADRNAFSDVITVLVSNACYALEGAPESAHVRVRVGLEDGWAVVTVEDDGPGVPPELEATMFQPFVTGRGRDAKHPGTGLGLAIAARWMERHEGTLVHERPKAGGARFVARFRRTA